MTEDKALPSNIDAERFVLGSVMLDQSFLHSVRPALSADEFHTEKHRRIWSAACELYDSGGNVDRVTVVNALLNRGELDSCGGFSYLCSLDDGLPQIPNLDSYVSIVKDKATLRRIITATELIQRRALSQEEKPQDILESMAGIASDMVPQGSGGGLISAGELLEKIGPDEIIAPRIKRGIPLPWPWMNHHTCGWLPGELWVLAGHTSTGKSSAAIQAAAFVAARDFGAAIFSLEMGEVSIYQRALWQISGVDAERAKRGELDRGERERISATMEGMSRIPLYFDDSSMSLMKIQAELRRQWAKRKLGLIVIDYLQLLEDSGRHGTRAEAVGHNARVCKQMAVEFKATVLLLSQFNRESSKPNSKRRPELSDLKESGDIENHANGVWFIHRENMQDQEVVPVEFILPKQREGRRGILTDQIAFRTRFQRFDETTEREAA